MEEELIGGFTSSNMKRGIVRGYGLYVTTHRIIGVKKGWKQWVGLLGGVVVGPSGGGMIGAGSVALGATAMATGWTLRELSSDYARKAIKQLESKMDFEVRKEELEEIRIQRNTGWFKRTFLGWRYDVTIRTAKDVYTISPANKDEVTMLKLWFYAFDINKVTEDPYLYL